MCQNPQCSEASQQTFFDEIDIAEVSTSHRECRIVLTYKRIRFVVVMAANDGDTMAEWLAKLDEAQDDPDEMVYHDAVAEIQQTAVPVCEALIRSLAVSMPQHHQPEHITLEGYLNRPTVFLQLRATEQGGLKATRLEDPGRQAEMLQPCAVPGEWPEAPRFLASDIQYIQDLYIGQVAQVSHQGEIYAFKSADDGSEDQISREIQVLQQIAELRRQGALRDAAVPQFVGLVTCHDRTIGFLEEFIDGKRLSELDLNRVPISQRQIWRRRIEETVALLHQHDIVWGDVKPENVLVRDDRVWIIDFGGSWTEGWVDEELAETVQGDAKGLQRLIRFLRLQEESKVCSLEGCSGLSVCP